MRIELPGEGVAKFLATGDLDGDERAEIVAADVLSNRVWILWGGVDGVTVSHVTLGDGKGVSGSGDNDIRPIVVADFDHDGHRDLATVEAYSSEVVVLFGEGVRWTGDELSKVEDRNFTTSRLKLDDESSPGALAAADFDGDGIDDLAVANRDANEVSIWLSNRDRRFTPWGTIAAAQEPVLLELNINGDANPDRVTLDDRGNALTFELDDGKGGFVSADVLDSVRRLDPIVVDLDADGISDVLSVSGGGEILARLGRSKTAATFHPPRRLFGDAKVRDVTAVATKGGWMIAATDREGDTVSIFSRDTTTGEWNAQTLAAGGGPSSIVAGNVTRDLDGLDDLVVVNALSQDASVFVQQADGSFVSRPRLPIGDAAADLLLADFLGTSAMDLAIVKPAAGVVTIWEGKGDGTFGAASNMQAGDGLYGVSDGGAVRSLHKTSSLATGNFNGDTRADLVAANALSNSFALFAGKGAGGGGGTITGPTLFGLEASPDFVVAADFNPDGRNDRDDIAAVYRSTGHVVIRLNNEQGGFEPESRFKAGTAIAGLSVGDANGDKKLDLLVNNQFGDLLILQGNGLGQFEPYFRADPNVHLAVADLDGKPGQEFIFANESLDTLRVESNDGTPRFDQQAGGILAPGTVQVADLDRDGLKDLIVPNSGGNNILVYRGLPGGGFASPPTEKHTGGNPSHVSIGDVSGDGVLDLVVANEGSNDVTVLLGAADGDGVWTLVNGPRLNLKLGDSQGVAPVHTFIRT